MKIGACKWPTFDWALCIRQDESNLNIKWFLPSSDRRLSTNSICVRDVFVFDGMLWIYPVISGWQRTDSWPFSNQYIWNDVGWCQSMPQRRQLTCLNEQNQRRERKKKEEIWNMNHWIPYIIGTGKGSSVDVGMDNVNNMLKEWHSNCNEMRQIFVFVCVYCGYPTTIGLEVWAVLAARPMAALSTRFDCSTFRSCTHAQPTAVQ